MIRGLVAMYVGLNVINQHQAGSLKMEIQPPPLLFNVHIFLLQRYLSVLKLFSIH